MDPQLQALGLQLADATIRNTASGIADRITAAKARRRDNEIIAELEEIVNSLLQDKNELVRIAKSFEDELVAQRISATDVEYIATNFVPLIEQLAGSAAEAQQQDVESLRVMIGLLTPLLSVETVTILQLLGFNFRRAVGEPLTELVAQMIIARRRQGDIQAETQRLTLEIASDPEKFERLRQLLGRG